MRVLSMGKMPRGPVILRRWGGIGGSLCEISGLTMSVSKGELNKTVMPVSLGYSWQLWCLVTEFFFHLFLFCYHRVLVCC